MRIQHNSHHCNQGNPNNAAHIVNNNNHADHCINIIKHIIQVVEKSNGMNLK